MSRILAELVAETGISPTALTRLIADAPTSYKVFTIRKRNGGLREIAQPSRPLKMVQRALVNVLLKKLPVDASAKAYLEKTSILDNAIVHAGSNPILKMDFKDFFPSIQAVDWIRYCKENGILEPQDAILTANILFRRTRGSRVLRLSIGAPSSPILSNILMQKFDALLRSYLEPHDIKYTRYADDLTFSAPRTGHLQSVQKTVRKVLREIKQPSLTINKDKTVFATRKYSRSVTGLILANDGRITLGKSKKREIRSAIHYFMNGKLGVDDVEKLAGYLAFAASVEPAFVARMRSVYGGELVSTLMSTRPRRKLTPQVDRE